MKPLLIAALCVLAAAGCSSKKADESSTAVPDKPAAPASTAAPAAAPAGDATKVVITDALVGKYGDYQKQRLAMLAKYSEQTRKNLEAAKGDAAKTIQQISLNEKVSKELDEALKAKRAELGLRDEEFSALEDAIQMIANGRLIYNQMGGDAQLAKLEAEQKQQLAALPPAQRAEAEKVGGEMLKSLREVKDGGELRKKYGDQAADVLLKHADELAQQQMDAFKLLAGKK
jgi:hypothetical protein